MILIIIRDWNAFWYWFVIAVICVGFMMLITYLDDRKYKK